MSSPIIDTCVICAAAPATTRDHVPPRGFFKGSEAGLQLITVPACPTCNNGSSKLDEQLRLYISMEAGKPTPEAAALWEKGALKSLARSEGLRRLFGEARLTVQDEASGTLRDAVLVPVNLADAVIGRTVRGLHFHHTGKVLPPDARILVGKMDGPVDLNQDTLSMLNEANVGGDMFRYRWGVTPEDVTAGLWVLQFHRSVTYYAQTGAIADSSDNDDA